MIPQNEITALLSVIERLEQTQRLTPLQIFRKEQARAYRFSPNGRDPGVHAHQRKYGKKSVFFSRAKRTIPFTVTLILPLDFRPAIWMQS